MYALVLFLLLFKIIRVSEHTSRYKERLQKQNRLTQAWRVTKYEPVLTQVVKVQFTEYQVLLSIQAYDVRTACFSKITLC